MATDGGPVTRMRTDPIPVVRSRRGQDFRGITSLDPGKCVPLVAFPLLREDQLETTRFRFSFEMMETVEILMNAVSVRVLAYLVPNLAFDRYDGMDALNRSYMKQPSYEPAGPVIPYFTTIAMNHTTNKIFNALGVHATEGAMVNAAYVEAYNEIFNFRAANRSPDLVKRAVQAVDLAPAFWNHQVWSNIVPDFDQAVIDGEVPLNVIDSKLIVKGIGNRAVTGPIVPNVVMRESNSTGNTTYPFGYSLSASPAAPPASHGSFNVKSVDDTGLIPDIWAELNANGITVSLANIEVARKTQAFAALRKLYTGHDDDYIIDLLMNGITVPEQEWRLPMLLADRSTIFGMAKRYSSSADDLTASVANGATYIDIGIRTPRCSTGGVVMIVAEVTPEQLWERQQDPYVFTTDQETLPEFLRDTLDPEKVEVVQNQYVDVDHDTPTATFGYAPLNHKWLRRGPMIGGKFYRPAVDAPFDEDRQRFWAVETQNPVLSTDFYLCTTMHTKPFVVTDKPPFECVTRGVGMISGNTVFGQMLIEASDDYDTIMAEVPMERIEKP